ncbi:MAG: ThuA domain-containing protein [Treponema sp.]|nr:ThuA domain-containing protein [Treponema sp.]
MLLICDDYWHPGQTAVDGTAPLKESGFQFDVIFDAKDFSPDSLKQYNAVLICKMDEVSQTDKSTWKTDAVQKAFVDYVEGGGGLVAVHSAVVQGKDTQKLDKLLGCRFIGHPNNCPVTVSPVKPHPVTEGVCLFCETDEHYRIEITSPDADVLLASYSPPQGEESKYQNEPYFNTPAGIYPAGFVRTQGKGRVCVLTPGHLTAVWLNPQFQKLLTNALNWCAANNR